MKYSFILPVYNEEKYIARSIRSLLELDYAKDEYEIIVVDNGSTDSTANIVNSFDAVTMLKKENCNVGAVRNFGAQHSKGEYLCFIDSDCLVDKGWLNKCDELIENNKDTTFGGRIILDDEATWVEKYWLLGEKDEFIRSKDLLGSCTLINKEIFNKINGFNVLLTSSEDTQLTNDLRSNGFKVEISNAINVIHLGNAKTVREFYSRQKWHGATYIQNLSTSIKDPTFIMILLFLFLTTSLVLSIAIDLPYMYSLAIGLILMALPLVFSLKRITRSEKIKRTPEEFLKIYSLDVIYLAGRISGLLKEVLSSKQ